MTAKEFLEQPKKIQKKLKYLGLEKEHYTQLMHSVSSVCFSDVKVDKSPSTTTPNMYGMMKLDETERKIAELEKEYERVYKEVDDKIDTLEKDEYRLLLKYRYLEFMSTSEVADLLYVSYKTVQRWHDDAINQLIF